MRQTQNTQKNSNRKSVFIIALLLLLVAVIGFGGYTMSKYISSKSDNGTASVAKWGFTVSADADDLFGTNYKFDNTNSVVTDETTGLTVKASDTNNKVAPGTTGSMTFEVTGTAEVKSKVEIKLGITSDVILKYTATGVTAGEYIPLKWTLKKDNIAVTGAEGVSLAEIKTLLEGTDYCKTVEAGEEYSQAGKYTLSWEWAFEDGANNDEKAKNNALDTLLGMIANDDSVTVNGDYTKAEGTSTKVEFDLSVSVTQLKGNE